MIEDLEYKCSVGALLYSPATSRKLARGIVEEKYGRPYSVAMCLEDAIGENMVKSAEENVKNTLREICREREKRKFFMPKLFIRVREPEQMERIFLENEDCRELITGFIFPKYSVGNGEEYNRILEKINRVSARKIYMMPILESGDIISYETRRETLTALRRLIDSMREYVLNVRVGGNDFCSQFGLRRRWDQTIYEVLPVAGVLTDILTEFSRDYIVSAPVWEYFDGEEWERGLERELAGDRLNGFTGKTVIHPRQIQVVNRSFMVSEKDYKDALRILEWDTKDLLVAKSGDGKRMDEVKTHYSWAVKTKALAGVYGVAKEE